MAVAVLATAFAVNQAEARKESNRRLQESRLRVAALDYERGQDACEQGKLGLGLLRLVQSWRSAVAAGDPLSLARAVLAVAAPSVAHRRRPLPDPAWAAPAVRWLGALSTLGSFGPLVAA